MKHGSSVSLVKLIIAFLLKWAVYVAFEETLLQALELEFVDLFKCFSSQNEELDKKYAGLLEKKWTSVIRLQKKVSRDLMDLLV